MSKFLNYDKFMSIKIVLTLADEMPYCLTKYSDRRKGVNENQIY